MRNYLLKDHHCSSNHFRTPCTQLATGEFVAEYSKNPSHNGPNQDAFFTMEINSELAVVAIADGAGGHPLGHEASSLQVQCLYQAIKSAAPNSTSLRDYILNAIELCNSELLARGRGSATTVIVLEIAGNVIRTYHVGDSSALVIGQRGKVKYRTLSHSPVALGIESGFIEPENALHHAERHIVLNLVGTKTMRVEIGSPITLNHFDTVLLCSDGLTDNLLTDEIVSIVRAGSLINRLDSLHSACQIQMRPELGYPDDISVILYRLGKSNG